MDYLEEMMINDNCNYLRRSLLLALTMFESISTKIRILHSMAFPVPLGSTGFGKVLQTNQGYLEVEGSMFMHVQQNW